VGDVVDRLTVDVGVEESLPDALLEMVVAGKEIEPI
jgi:hypothetical protein